MLHFINRFQLLQAMPSASFFLSLSLFLSQHIYTQPFVGSKAALTFSDLLAPPAAGTSQVKGCMARPKLLCSVEGLNSTGFCVWLFLLVIYKLSTCSAFQAFSDRALLHWCMLLLCLTWFLWGLLFSPESGLLKVCHSSTGVNCCSIASLIHCLVFIHCFLANKYSAQHKWVHPL